MTEESRPRTRWEPEPRPPGSAHINRLDAARESYNRLIRDGATHPDPGVEAAWTDLHAAVKAALLRELEDQVRALPAEGRRHVGLFVERAVVLALITE